MPYEFKTTVTRSALMRKIKSVNTAPEKALQKALRGAGVRFSSHSKTLPGKPDVLIKTARVAVFIDGEFWHGYKWHEKKKKIKANRRYWIPKIEKNIARDKKYLRELRKAGWKPVRFWQHQIVKDMDLCLLKIKNLIQKKPSG